MKNQVVTIKLDRHNIDADLQETFSLCSFRHLMIEKFRQKKDFLIARVASITECILDGTKTKHTSFFFFCANALNKYLFKYEAERRLLHRMRVRNPVNNVFILGKVEYFKVNYSLSLFIELQSKPDVFDGSVDSSDYFQSHKHKTTEEMLIKGTRFATDEDFLIKPETRQFFKQNCDLENEEFLFKFSRENSGIIDMLQSMESTEDNTLFMLIYSLIYIHVIMIFVLSFVFLLIINFKECRFVVGTILLVCIISFSSIIIYFVFFRKDTLHSLNTRSNVEI
ncbi:hypothetical protein CDIK_1394 [Cucumispora dikerogammari]|nr:hypothetical protein CDIK_1394 [Cucumispora dikerogammari]